MRGVESPLPLDPARPSDVRLIEIALTIAVELMFLVSFWIGRDVGADYSTRTVMGFTAASTDYELAIATAVAVFGVSSGVTFATVIDPLIEVAPVLSLVTVALALQRRLAWTGSTDEETAGSEAIGD